MNKYWRAFSVFVLAIFLAIITTPLTFSQIAISSADQVDKFKTTEILIQANRPTESSTNSKIEKQQPNSNPQGQNFPVVLEGETLFYFSSIIKGIPAKNRAREASQAIEKVARNFTFSLDSFKIVELEAIKLIFAEDKTIFAVLPADAKITNLAVDDLAQAYLQITKNAIARYRITHSHHRLSFRIVIVIIEAILLLIFLLIFLRKLAQRIHQQIRILEATSLRPIVIQNWQVCSIAQEVHLVLVLAKLIYWLGVVGIFLLYLSLLAFHLPQTQPWRKEIFKFLFQFLYELTQSAIAYLPNFLIILLTIFIAYKITRFSRVFFNAIEREKLSIKGFYPEWAKPTQKLFMVLIIALTFATIFPLLPGSKSPAFRGISIFAGALFTLGGASTIANLVGGFIIIYTRAFQIGDRVQVDNVIGTILEKTILSTRIRTAKNEIVTIPNANLITSKIKNFTTAYREINQPLILHTIVTLGYGIPWRKVHQVLTDAALSSNLTLNDPAPFILQTNLGDFSVSYELNVYIDQPTLIPKIYSQLHQNIQDKCNEAGIEILSPHYAAIRDGNQNTMPAEYLPQDYQPSGFRFNPLNQLLNQPGKSNNLPK